MKLNNLWWGPPKKFSPDIEERKISWLELFYDLVYVIVISRSTQHFAAHPDFDGFFYYVFFFGMIFWGWLNGSMYYDLHGTPGIRSNLMTLWQMLAVAALAVTQEFKHDVEYHYYTLALIFLQVFITYLWWSVGFYDKDHRRLNIPLNICYLVNIILLVIALNIHSSFKPALYWLILIINFIPAFFINSIFRKTNRMLDISSSMVERLGLFTIIVFGECILGVINGMIHFEGHSKHTWIAFGLAILIVFSLWFIFFSMIADRKCKPGFLQGYLFQLMFVPSLITLGMMGATFSLMLNADVTGTVLSTNIRLLFGGSVAVFIICIYLLSVFLEYDRTFGNPKKIFGLILLPTAALLALLTCLFPDLDTVYFLLMVFCILLAMIVVLTYGWYKKVMTGN